MKKMVLLFFLLSFIIGLNAQNVKINDSNESFIQTELYKNQVKFVDELLLMEKIKQDIEQTRQVETESILDSVVYYQFDTASDSNRLMKREYEFDASGNIVNRLEYNWDEENMEWMYFEKKDYFYQGDIDIPSYEEYRWDSDLGIWINYKKVTFIFDEDGNEETYFDLRWNIDLDRWDKHLRLEYTYDEQGHFLLETCYKDDELNEWIVFYVYENSYNDEGLLEISTLSFWNEDMGDLEYYQKEEFSYLPSGLEEERLYYIWMSNEWVNSNRTYYFYSASDMVDSSFTSIWQVNEWLDFAYMKFSYDESDNEIIRERFVWEDELWINDEKTEMDYDANNNKTLIMVSRRPYDEEYLVFEYKIESQYNDYNSTLMSSWYNWNLDVNDWEGTEKHTSTYNNQGERTISFIYIWDEMSFDWILDQKGYYYRSIIDGLLPPLAQEWIIFPNPVENTLYIKRKSTDGAAAKIISLGGQVIIHVELQGLLNTINIDNLSEGIYFLELNEGGIISTQKIIKE